MSRVGFVIAGLLYVLAIAGCAVAAFLCPYPLPRALFVVPAAEAGFLLRDLLGEDWV